MNISRKQIFVPGPPYIIQVILDAGEQQDKYLPRRNCEEAVSSVLCPALPRCIVVLLSRQAAARAATMTDWEPR